MGATPNIEDHSVELENARASNARTAEESKRQQDAVDQAAFGKRLLDSFTGAETSARSQLTDRGLDPEQYWSPVEAELQRVRSTIPNLDPSPGAYFTPDIVDSVLNRQQDLTRTRNTNAVNERFGSGFERAAIGDSADDPLIDKIVNEEYDRAKSGIDASYKRGNLNDAGYNYATGELDRGKTTGKTTVSGFGDAVLNRYRGDLTGIKDRAVTGANSYTLGGSSFDINPYADEVGTKTQSDLGNLEGDLRGAVGSTPLFDVGSILQKAGGAQGPVNPRNSGQDMIASVLTAQRKKNNTGQGVGSGGVF